MVVVRGEGGRGRVTSGHIPPPQPPAQAGPASTAACDTRELHKVREENLQNDSIFIQCLISLPLVTKRVLDISETGKT